MKFKEKKAELTTQQIVMIIILITSFTIILFLLFRLNLGETTNEQLCYNSVVSKGSSVLPPESISLDCHTKYICITEDKTCEGLTNPEVIEVDNLDEIYNQLAEEMTSCWWMFGEGEIDYVGDDLTRNNYCSICSQILFDDSLENIGGIDKTISKDEFYNYLEKTNYSGEKITYAEYLFGTNDINQLKQELLESSEQKGEATFGDIEIGKQYFVVMGITSEIGGWGYVGAGIGIVVGGVIGISTGSLIIGGIIVAATTAGGAIIGTGGQEIVENSEIEIGAIIVKGKGIDNQFMAPTIVEVDSDKFKAINCEEILTFT